jgi:hypothetical protein
VLGKPAFFNDNVALATSDPSSTNAFDFDSQATSSIQQALTGAETTSAAGWHKYDKVVRL